MEASTTTTPAVASTTRPDWNEFDEFTLSVMSNRNHYDKYLKAKTNAQTLADIFRREQVYYKERIIDMTRDLFDGECADIDVNESYHAYMKCCIRYLKWKDVTEMIQKEKYSAEGGPELKGAAEGGPELEGAAEGGPELEGAAKGGPELKGAAEGGPELEGSAEDTDAVNNARQELDKRIQESPLPAPEAPIVPAAQSEPEPAAAPAAPRYIEDNKALISFANKMCIRKKTMDDFIVMKPAPVASSVNLPQIRDYHDEIAKRSEATEQTQ